jgi:hypoxanthine-DNA glycosylase
MLRGLPPIIDAEARVLILGSFPSAASLQAQRYYAHPRNQFWRILGAWLEVPLSEMEYAGRQAALADAGVAIWDVFACCERSGSLDSAIRNGVQNNFHRLKPWAPQLRRVCFNGLTAARFVDLMASMGYETRVLPSTSPAYTLNFAQKLERWRDGMTFT